MAALNIYKTAAITCNKVSSAVDDMPVMWSPSRRRTPRQLQEALRRTIDRQGRKSLAPAQNINTGAGAHLPDRTASPGVGVGDSVRISDAPAAGPAAEASGSMLAGGTQGGLAATGGEVSIVPCSRVLIAGMLCCNSDLRLQ